MKKTRFSFLKKPWFLLLLSLFLILICFGAYAYSKFDFAKENYKKVQIDYHTPLRDQSTDAIVANLSPLSFLLLGVDARENDTGRSDTMIVATINPKTNETKVVSIPRDSYVELKPMNEFDKINHAYAKGGIEASTQTVENLLGIPIDYVIKLNMEGLKDLVDAIGGITINNTFEFKSNESTFKKGTLTLDGTETLNYIKMRKQDPNGDFGRQERQKQVVKAIVQQLKSPETLQNFDNIITVLGYNLKTNIPFKQLTTLLNDYVRTIQTYDNLSLRNGDDLKKDGIYYYSLNVSELQTVITEFKTNLQLK